MPTQNARPREFWPHLSLKFNFVDASVLQFTGNISAKDDSYDNSVQIERFIMCSQAWGWGEIGLYFSIRLKICIICHPSSITFVWNHILPWKDISWFIGLGSVKMLGSMNKNRIKSVSALHLNTVLYFPFPKKENEGEGIVYFLAFRLHLFLLFPVISFSTSRLNVYLCWENYSLCL